MRTDKASLPSDVTEENLKRLSGLHNVNTELRIMELGDLIGGVKKSIDSMIDLGNALEDVLLVASSQIKLPSHNERVTDDMTGGLTKSYTDISENLDRAVIASLLSRYFEERGFSESDFLMGEDMPETFTYVKNVFADEAFDVLSQDFEDSRVRYSRDFSECVKLLLSGEVSYCLLPFEERGGMRLPTVEELIFRNDLKISSVTPVFGPDGTQDLKYALVSDRFNLSRFTPEDDRYLEIRISESDNPSLADIMSAASFFGHTVYRVNTLSLTKDEREGQLFSIVFRAEGNNFSPLLTYLSLFLPNYFIVGIYKNQE